MKLSLPKRGIALAAALFLCASAVLADSTDLTPTGDGTYQQWTPKSGAMHYTQVDESLCNGTTDYVRATTVGLRDSYTTSLSGIPDGSSLTEIRITPCASRNTSGGTGSSTLNVFYRLNGSDSSDKGAYALTGTTPVALATSSFQGLAVDKIESTTLEIGGVYSSGNKGVRLSRIVSSVFYLPLLPPSNLTSSSSTSSITVLWTGTHPFVDNYALYRSTDGTNFSHLATTSTSTTSYLDSGLASGTYSYRLKSYNAGYYSVFSTTTATSTIP